MQHAELMAWRKNLRRELLARRQALPADRLQTWRLAMDRHLQYGFPGLARGVVAFCWPIQNEYDARHLVRRLREQGATAALPVVLAPNRPLIFRAWHPGVEMALGKLEFLGVPRKVKGSSLSSPVCYADELAPGYFGDDTAGA